LAQTRSKLGALLLQAGVITSQQLKDCLELARKRNASLQDVVLQEKLVSEEVLAATFAQWLKLPHVRIASTTVEPDAIKKIGEDLARKHVCLPLRVEGKSLALAMANPADYDVIQDVQFVCGLTVHPVVATRTEILDGIDQYYATEGQLEEFLAKISDTTDLSILAQEQEEVDLQQLTSRSAADLPPVIKVCNLILQDAIKAHASDIHVEPRLTGLHVRLRVDGVLRDHLQTPKWLHPPVVSRLKILADLDIAERRLPQDGRIKVQFQGKPLDIRVSTLPTHFGEKVVMRLLGTTTIPTFKAMGMSDADSVTLESALKQPEGMILVTGPTGAGKTTSLYSMIARRKSPDVNITTIEDPIEYQLPGINQVQVNVKAGLTFASCLRSILRQDPDVILVGEIRDSETAEIAVRSAMTGHLVLSTVHTNSSLATISRLLDLAVEPSLITSSVLLIIAQRLVRRICGGCKEPYTPSRELLDRFQLGAPESFYRGRGCAACGQTGYAGRIGVFEVLRMTASLKEKILRKAGESELHKTAVLTGTRFLFEDAMDKVRQGLTSFDEVLRVIQVQEDEVMRCPSCRAFIDLNFSTCPYCLHPLKCRCTACGQDLKPDWKVCPYCNTPNTWAPAAGGAGPGAGAGDLARPASEPAPPAAAPAAPEATADPVVTEPATRLRILVVEDDEGTRRVIQRALSRLPAEIDVVTAADGLEALATIERQTPNLVISDVNMPRMDGFALCERLREDIRTAFVPIMMLTGSADEANRTKGFLVGTDDFVPKPFSISELNARVMRLLRRAYGVSGETRPPGPAEGGSEE
jgi:type IV pilus assembly protein PilB